MGTVWHNVKIGGGGYCTGIDASNDGATICIRTDTYGGYVWEPGPGKWRQLITRQSMPSGWNGVDNNAGITELRVAPSDANRLYMAYMGDNWVSFDRGYTWNKNGLNWDFQYESSANGLGARILGQKMAVDPANPDVVYWGTPSAGVYVSTNAGRTWTLISTATIPACATAISGYFPGHPGICFDPTSGTTGGKTNKIYIPVYGTGLYVSTDAGATWNVSSGAPTKILHGRVAVDGIYYCANSDASNANTIWKFSAGSWTAIGHASRGAVSIIPDISDATRLILVGDGGYLAVSTNRGASWNALLTTVTRTSSDIPWLAWTAESYMSVGDMIFDPANPTTIIFAEGIGPWTTTFSGTPSSTAWTSRTKGIENLTGNTVCLPPGGKPLMGGWDRSVFYIADPETYPSTHSPDNSQSIRMAWDIDWASSDPTFIAYNSFWNGAVDNLLGWKSTDRGQTWTAFSGMPVDPSAALPGGCIACSTPQNIIIIPANDSFPFYTKDGGATWSKITIAGVPTSGEAGYGHAYFSSNKCVAADRVAANTFYIFNYITQGLYRSTDSGDTWTKMNTGNIDTQAVVSNAKLVSVPGQQGHLFLAGGRTGNPGDANPGGTKFRRSTDGGATWADVGGGTWAEPYCVALGAAAPGQSYPAVYAVGWLNSVFGIYRSIDNCVSWTNIGDYPANWLDAIKNIDASKDDYGTVYVSFSGASNAYRTEAMQYGRLR